MVEFCGPLNAEKICECCDSEDLKIDDQDNIGLAPVMNITDRGLYYGQSI